MRLQSGQELPADVIVTATGLQLNVLADFKLSIAGAPVDLSQALVYKGMMYAGVPNLASTFGCTNASWTLKADLTAGYFCRLLNHMDRHGQAVLKPSASGAAAALRFKESTRASTPSDSKATSSARRVKPSGTWSSHCRTHGSLDSPHAWRTKRAHR